MLFSKSGTAGAFSAPHHLAAQTGRDVLREGGSAIEAMVAAAATIAVVYPHMNGIGGDGFWLIQRAGKPMVGIEACGRAAKLATPDWYKARGHEHIPTRGPHAALTTPGTIGGWRQALDLVPADRRISLDRLLADAIAYATGGFTTSWSQSRHGREKSAELLQMPGFADAFMPGGTPPAPLRIADFESTAPREGGVPHFHVDKAAPAIPVLDRRASTIAPHAFSLRPARSQ